MEEKKIGPLGPLQIRLLRKLWAAESWTIGELCDALVMESPEAGPGYSTVASVMGRMERRGLVSHRRLPGSTAFDFFPLVTLEEVRSALTRDLAESLFSGMPSFRYYVATLP